MAHETKLEFHFLSGDGQSIFYGGEKLDGLPTMLFFLLIYLVTEGHEEYNRDEVKRNLGWIEKDLTDILHQLRKRLGVANCLPVVKTHDKSIIFFDRKNVWVDSWEFFERATEIMNKSKNAVDSALADQIYETLSLYKAPFLHNVKLAKNSELTWIEKHRTTLSNLYQALLNRLIEFHIVQGQLDEAKIIAQRWLNSAAEILIKPLQYLIWIGIKQGNLDEVEQIYLARLRKYENPQDSTSLRKFDHKPTAKEWHEFITQKKEITLDLIGIKPHGLRTALRALPHHYVNDTAVRNHLTDVLLDPQGPPVVGLIGQSGIGKTLLAQWVIEEIYHRYPMAAIPWVDLRPEFDLDLLLDEVLVQLKLNNLLPLNSTEKRVQFQKAIKSTYCLIVLDEGLTGNLASREKQEALVALFAGARLLLVANQLNSNGYYEYRLNSFDTKTVKIYLTQHATHLERLRDLEIQAIREFSQGIPLALSLIAGGLKKQRIEFMSFVQAQASQAEKRLEQNVYAAILQWQWGRMFPAEKAMLYAITFFDYREGCTTLDLSKIITQFSPEKTQSVLQGLVNYAILTQDDTKRHYFLHPTLAEIIKTYEIDPILLSKEEIEKNYLSYLISIATTNADNFDSLDRWRYDLLKLFYMVLVRPELTHLRKDTLDVVTVICGYFERRGLYTMVRELTLLALEGLDDKRSVPLLSRLGQISLRQNGSLEAEKHFNQAQELARRAGSDELYALTLRDFGNSAQRKREYPTAIAYYNEGMELARENDPILFAQIRANLAAIDFNEGNLAKAEALCREIEQDLQNAMSSLPYEAQDVLQYITNLQGAIAHGDERYKDAQEAYERSLKAARRLNNPDRIARIYFNIASARFYQGDVKEAAYHYMLGDVVAEHYQNNELLIWSWWNKATMLVYQKEYDAGRKLLTTALDKALQLQLDSECAHIWLSSGILNLHERIHDKAKDFFMKALEVETATLWTKAMALYGAGIAVCYSMLVQIIGKPDLAYQQITTGFATLPLPINSYNKLSPVDIRRAGTYFRVALPHILEYGDKEITMGLGRWLEGKK